MSVDTKYIADTRLHNEHTMFRKPHKFFIKFSGGLALDSDEKFSNFADICQRVGKMITIHLPHQLNHGYLLYDESENMTSLMKTLNELRPFNMKFVLSYRDDDGSTRTPNDDNEDTIECEENLKYTANGYQINVISEDNKDYVMVDNLDSFDVDLTEEPTNLNVSSYKKEMEKIFYRYMIHQAINFRERNKSVVLS